MPPQTKIGTFLEAVRTRRTTTTDALDSIFSDPASVPAEVKEHLANANALNKARSAAWRESAPVGWARSALKAAGLNKAECDHVRDWPDDEKEKVRAALHIALKRGLSVRFNWELWTGNKSVSDVPARLPADGTVQITFRSPEQRVRVRGGRELDVDVP